MSAPIRTDLAGRNASIAAAYAEGHSIGDVAKAFGLGRSTVYSILVRSGTPRRPRHHLKPWCSKWHALRDGNLRLQVDGDGHVHQHCRRCEAAYMKIYKKRKRAMA